MTEVPLRAAIVGCGLIGQKRARALTGAKLVASADLDIGKARALAGAAEGCAVFSDWRDLIKKRRAILS